MGYKIMTQTELIKRIAKQLEITYIPINSIMERAITGKIEELKEMQFRLEGLDK